MIHSDYREYTGASKQNATPERNVPDASPTWWWQAEACFCERPGSSLLPATTVLRPMRLCGSIGLSNKDGRTMAERVGVALVGAGWAGTRHVAAYRALSDVAHLVAVADARPEIAVARGAAWGVPFATSVWADAIARP